MRRRAPAALRQTLVAAALFVASLAPATSQGVEPITVALDQATIVKLPERVATLVIGNPLIADATIQAGGMLVVTGRGYGMTNVIALDRAGTVLMERSVRVRGPREGVVTVFRGIERESFACAPTCERAVVLGDTPAHFDSALNQTGNRNSQVTGQSQTR